MAFALLNVPVRGGPVDALAAFVAAAVAIGALYSAFRGGYNLDAPSQQLVRWRGLSPQLAFRWQEIPFADIEGIVMSLSPASSGTARYRLQLATSRMLYDLKDGIAEFQLAEYWGQRLSAEFGCGFEITAGRGDWRGDDQSHLPRASAGGILLSLAAIATCWIPILGAVTTGVAMYRATKLYSLPSWLALLLAMAFLFALVLSAVYAMAVWHDWAR